MHQERWGSHLGEHTARGTMVPSRSKLHSNFLELRWSFGPLRIPRPLVEQYCCYSYRQHSRGCLYEGTGGDEVRPSLCPSVENPDLLFQETGDSNPTHSRRLTVIAHKLSSLTQLNRTDRRVPLVRVFRNEMPLVAPRLGGPVFCHLACHLAQLSSLGIDPPIGQ